MSNTHLHGHRRVDRRHEARVTVPRSLVGRGTWSEGHYGAHGAHGAMTPRMQFLVGVHQDKPNVCRLFERKGYHLVMKEVRESKMYQPTLTLEATGP